MICHFQIKPVNVLYDSVKNGEAGVLVSIFIKKRVIKCYPLFWTIYGTCFEISSSGSLFL